MNSSPKVKRMDARTKALSVAMLVTLSLALAAGAAELPPAAQVLKETGVSAGLAVIVGTTDGALESELARAKFVVQGMALSDQAALAARKRLLADGAHGQATIQILTSVQRLPYPDNFVNLLVAGDVPIPREEAVRVLAPDGVALFLAGALGAADRTLVKRWPAEFDQWTHARHSPDGNPVSRDTAVGPPQRVQWVAGPPWSRTHDSYPSVTAMVTAGGRIFYILDEGSAGVVDARFPDRWALYARDAFNGALLWRVPIKDCFRVVYRTDVISAIKGPWRETLQERLVAQSNLVFIKPGAREPIAALDAATGKVQRTFDGTSGSQAFAVHRGALVAGKNVFDAATGKLLWEGAGSCVMAGDSLFQFKDRPGVRCVELRTGKERWSLDEQVAGRPASVIAADGRLFLLGRGETVALAQDSGKVLWRKPIASSAYRTMSMEPGPYVIRGRLWTQSGVSYDAATGEDRREIKLETTSGHHPRCYGPKATARFILTGKRGIEYHDITTGTSERCDWVRPTCGLGFMPANGMTYVPPHPCFCYTGTVLHGLFALTPGPVVQPSPAPERLRTAAVTGAPAAAPTDAGPSWPTFRHDTQRSGATTARVPANVAPAWRTKLGGRLTAPVAADGRLYVGLQDAAAVVCLDSATGKELWRFGCGGRMDSPPTIHDGLALFGCTDGWVYAVRTQDGQEAWRFRVAPVERLTGGFARVESAWPVKGSVLVQGGKAYAIAGRSSYLDGGIVLVALDPATGKLLHETRVAHASADIPVKSTTLSSGFAMEGALPEVPIGDGERVYMRQYEFDGKLAVLPVKRLTRNGDTEVGLHLMATSNLLDESGFNRTFWTYSRRWPGYYFGTDAPKSGQMLVFGGSTTYGVKAHAGKQGRHSSIFFAGKEGWMLFADDNANEPALDPASANKDKGKPGLMREKSAKWTAWAPILVRAMVLTGADSKERTLFVCGPPDVVDEKDPLAAYEGRAGSRLRAVSASEGKTLAEVQLDAAPVWDGLIAAEGRLFLALADGSFICLSAPTR